MSAQDPATLDAQDPLAEFRDRFHVPPSPKHDDGRPSIYLCGNSLGLQPKALARAMDQELADWRELGVEGHFEAKNPWLPYHEPLRDLAAPIVGAHPDEVVLMNSLTVNLHLLMVSFYRPTAARPAILIDRPVFPSDIYAVKSQLRFHGHDPEADLISVGPREGEHTVRTADLLEAIERDGDRIALVLLGGVNYLTGQLVDVATVTKAAQAKGCSVGVDLAHAAGNVPLALHDWNVDFAAWCNYKYLNSGPGAIAGAFVHRRHLGQGGAEDFAAFQARPRFEGWWGNDPAERFKMEDAFVPIQRVDAWQLSNPPILALAPVRVSLELFREAGLEALREKSLALTGFLRAQIEAIGSSAFEIVTPREPAAHGCQLSILVHQRPEELHQRLQAAGVICDFRRPNVIRVAPTPLYNSFQDCAAFAQVLAAAAAEHA